jgi:hypothetical protein
VTKIDYQDEYSYAAMLVVVGKVVRIGSFVVMWLIVLADLILFSMKAGDRDLYTAGGAAAVKVGLLGYIIGLLLTACGKNLKVSTDVAAEVARRSSQQS